MPCLSRNQLHQALGLVQGGLTHMDMARRMGCSHTIIKRLIEWHTDTDSLADRHRLGFELVTKPAQDRHIRLMHLWDWLCTVGHTAQDTIGVRDHQIRGSTVEKQLQNAHLAARRLYRGNILTEPRQQRRLEKTALEMDSKAWEWCPIHRHYCPSS